MTNSYKTLSVITILIFFVIMLATNGKDQAFAAEKSECFSLKELQSAFAVALPTAKQVVMKGDSARIYLEEFNNLGDRTDYAGQTLFLSVLPTGVVLMMPVKDGMGCRRRAIHPRLHQHIMIKVNRGRI